MGIGHFEEINYPYLLQIINIAQKYNLRTIVNHPSYCGIKGLTGRYQKLFNLPNVIQMEIKREFRDFYQYPEIVKNTTIPFLSEVLDIYK